MRPAPRSTPDGPLHPPGGTRAAILAAAARSFAARGYHRTSLHDVAEEVGIQKPSIFHHFAGKAALYRAVLREGHGQTELMISRALAAESGWLAQVHALLNAYIDLVASHPEQTQILIRLSLGDAPDDYDGSPDTDRLLGLVTGFLADGQRAGAFAPLDPLSLVLGVIGAVTFYFTSAPLVAPRWTEALSHETRVAQLRQLLSAIVVRALVPDAESPPREMQAARDE